MENKNSGKKHFGSKVIKLQVQDEETMASDIVALNDKEDIIDKGIRNNNGCQNNRQEPKNDLKKPSSSTSGKDNFAINIKQENLAINSTDSPTDPSAPMDTTTTADASTLNKDTNDQDENKQLKYSETLAKMGEVREENERLKLLLSRILKDYQSLQSHFFDFLRNQESLHKDKDQQDTVINPKDQTISITNNNPDHHDDQLLVSLSLGRTSSSGTTNDLDHDHDHEPMRKTVDEKTITKDHDHHGVRLDKLALALGQSSADGKSDRRKGNHDHDDEADPAAEIWPPSKALKVGPRPSGGGDDNEDGASQMSPLKKARVSVRARCDTPTMNDGCQWRKYGQKISKGNPCPRAYYRCTVSPSCPVRKQVQRCAEDMSILITTYEGTHNHPLPISATTMASTTSAAAAMLQSQSTASAATATQPLPLHATSPLPGLINSFSTNNNNPLLINRSHEFYFPNTSISTCNSHPTVTLDLTVPNPNTSHHLGINANRSALPRYSATCLSFSSSSNSSLDLPHNNNIGYGLNYNSNMSHARNYQTGSGALVVNSGSYNNIRQPYNQEANSSFYQLLPHNNMISSVANNPSTNHDQQSLMTETIAAATKAIASNPKFQSALAAALTSFVGNGGGEGGGGSSGA